jgi:hypothetical protein
MVVCLLVSVLGALQSAEGAADREWDLIPTPQYLEPLQTGILLDGALPLSIAVGEKPDPKVDLAASMIRDDVLARAPLLKGKTVVGEAANADGVSILLEDPSRAVNLNVLEKEAVLHASGQGYVLRVVSSRSVRIVGPPQGLLYGAMTLLQLAREGPGGLRIAGAAIRDFPHFELRAAADWLLEAEAERWSLDRGQGLARFEALCRKKLDLCLRYKINMVVFDGFGWSLRTRFPEYPALMRRLNRFARERGIHLVFGGYGASYEVLSRSEEFYNRESYPDGPIYSCMGQPGGKREALRGDRGTCRGNDDLNRLKARELEAFVRAVEPGALYIHHEDYGGTDSTQAAWKNRDERCRKRWPNDDLAAADGGAGALAHGYSWLLNAVNGVRSDDGGYVALRDCRIILVSPVYMPSSPSSEHWSRALELWQNIATRLPRAANVMACFRETFPQEHGAGKWTDAFHAALRRVGAGLGLYMFLCGGADHYLNDYPLVASAAMNVHFLGARAVYNFSGDAYQEPQQLLNAEYDWNATSRGFFRDARTHSEGRRVWHELAQQTTSPEEIFGDRGFLARACRRLYGPAAAAPMIRYYRESRSLPGDWGKERGSLPSKDERLYALPVLARRLSREAGTWKPGQPELHRKLKEYWDLSLDVARSGERLLKEALEAPPSASSREDLEFLLKSTRVAIPLCEALSALHDALADPERAKELLERAQEAADQASRLAAESFPDVIDPAGAEIGVQKTRIAALRIAVRGLQKP